MQSLLQCRCLILRSRTPVVFHKLGLIRFTSSSSTGDGGDDEWNDAWETAWLPDEGKSKEDKSVENGRVIASAAWDAETKAFVEDMNENWNHRRMSAPSKPQSQKQQQQQQQQVEDSNCSLYSLENIKRDYRLKKQRVHATLWMKEIEKHQEAKLAASSGLGGDDFDKLLDTCSDIFDSPHEDLANLEISSSFEFKNKPEGWETTSKAQDGSIWDMSQREEDILLQEFDRRIAFCKFQIASFIKTHIFSRRRPIDGWKYMIEELGPNARKGKGSVSRLPGISDASTQPFKEDKIAIGRTNSFKES